MSIAIDLLILLIIFGSIVGGIRKGFVRSVMDFVTFIAAIICAWAFAPILADFFSDSYFMQRITASVTDAIDKVIGGAASPITLDSLFAEKPAAFVDIIDRYSANIAEAERFYNAQVATGVQNAADKLSEFIAGPVASAVSNVIAFVVIFAAVSLVLTIIAVILDAVFKLPPLNTLNRVFGFMLGAVCGLLYAWAASMVLYAALPSLTALWPEVFASSLLDNSILLGIFYEYNIFRYIGLSVIAA